MFGQLKLNEHSIYRTLLSDSADLISLLLALSGKTNPAQAMLRLMLGIMHNGCL